MAREGVLVKGPRRRQLLRSFWTTSRRIPNTRSQEAAWAMPISYSGPRFYSLNVSADLQDIARDGWIQILCVMSYVMNSHDYAHALRLQETTCMDYKFVRRKTMQNM